MVWHSSLLLLLLPPLISAFKVIAFYDDDLADLAHNSFAIEAREWFPAQAALHGFSWQPTRDWSLLRTLTPADAQVVVFIDNKPWAEADRAGFRQYMDNGGAWMGFHVSAFTTDTQGDWDDWYHNTLLGSGRFVDNTWLPTAETLKLENTSHPAVVGLSTGTTMESPVSEWYSWSNDLRANPDIEILASLDESTFPAGTEGHQQWQGGYFPIVWTHGSGSRYRMIYANFGHNAMDYGRNVNTSTTFGSGGMNSLMIQGFKWLGGEEMVDDKDEEEAVVVQPIPQRPVTKTVTVTPTVTVWVDKSMPTPLSPARETRTRTRTMTSTVVVTQGPAPSQAAAPCKRKHKRHVHRH